MNTNYLKFDESLEEWRDIKMYEGLYQVSSHGRIRSLPRNTTSGKIKATILHNGYFRVNLYKNGKHKSALVHRLVAEAFLPNLNELPQVNHKNEIKTDNRVENLEWCTHEYNTNYGTRNQRVSEKLINYKDKSKLCAQFDMNMNLIATFPSTKEVYRQLGFAATHISDCCLGKSKTSYGYIWRYLQ